MNDICSPFQEFNTKCTVPGCLRWFKGPTGLNRHIKHLHAELVATKNPTSALAKSSQVFHDAEETSDPDLSDIEDSWFELIHVTSSWDNVGTYLLESDSDLGSDSDIGRKPSSLEAGHNLLPEVDVDFDFGHWRDLGSTPVDFPGLNASPGTPAFDFAELNELSPTQQSTVSGLLGPVSSSDEVQQSYNDLGRGSAVDSSSPPPESTPSESESSLGAEAQPEGTMCKLGRRYHNFLTADVCDEDDNNIPTDNEWAPFTSRVQFETAFFLYQRDEMSAGNINILLKLWEISLAVHQDHAPFRNHTHLYKTIDAIPYGEIPWKSLTLTHPNTDPEGSKFPWMEERHVVWYRDPMQVLQGLISNPDFRGEFDYVPYQDYNSDGHQFQDFMSGNWAWRQADIIKDDPDTRGAFFVPIILGSDKTTVSIATGNNEYWPLYISIGNIHNVARRGHRNGVMVLAFLSISKSDKEYRNTNEFRKFRRQLFHTSITLIFETIRHAMTKPVKVKCNDGKHRRAIFGFGPYIADYPEQCLLTCVVQGWCARCLASAGNLDDPDEPIIPRSTKHTMLIAEDAELLQAWDTFGMVTDVVPFTEAFPRADIYEMMSPDILHQLIKGTFKDHLVTWVGEYLVKEYGGKQAKKIMDDIDRRIAIVPSFPGLRRFPHGRDFKQWTGNDSKALMKVYLPALRGYVPADMIRALRAFLEFCYIVRQNSHSTQSLRDMENALKEFHQYREIFVETGVRKPNSWPARQHALKHYLRAILDFGSLNGLCSSITESKHIAAVKKPWRRSNRHDALKQMLVTNTRSDKLRAAHNEFKDRGLLDGTLNVINFLEALVKNTPSEDNNNDNNRNDDNDSGAYDGKRAEPSIQLSTSVAARNIGLHKFIRRLSLKTLPNLLIQYISEMHDLEHTDTAEESYLQLQVSHAEFTIHPSAIATYYAPSDNSGTNGMHHERIRAVPSWRKGLGRYDTVFIQTNSEAHSITSGLDVARVRQLFSFDLGTTHHCALIHEFDYVGDTPDEDTGMWIVRPLFRDSKPKLKIIPLNRIFRATHLIPVYDEEISRQFKHTKSLENFEEFFVNRYIDYHAFEIAI